MTRSPLLTLLAGSLLLLATSCSNGETERQVAQIPPGSQTATVTADFLIKDAAVDDLFSFSAELAEVRLVLTDDSTTDNLLRGPVTIEFLHLRDSFAWLTREKLVEDEYAAVQISFTPGSYRAKAQDGTEVFVDALSDELVAELPSPVDLDDVPYQRFAVDLDLRDSLDGDVSDGSVTFDPRGLTLAGDGTEPLELDGVLTIVTRRDTGTLTMEADVYADQLLEVFVGSVDFDVPQTTLLVNSNNFVLFSVPYFFTFLIPGSTIVDIGGELGPKGVVRTERLEIEDQVPVVGQVFPVKLEGRIAEKTEDYLFQFEIRNIERGEAFVGPYLEDIGNPRTVEVLVAPQLSLFFADENRLVTALDLQVGQNVKIKLSSFNGEPFLAMRVEIEGASGFPGTITDVDDLPDSFVMRLTPDSLAIRAGLVEHDETDVVVFLLEETAIVLGTAALPELSPDQLLEGLSVDVSGPLFGPPTAPEIDAVLIRVVPGLLRDARVLAATSPDSFDTTGGDIVRTFGGDLTTGPAGPLEVLVDEETLFRGAAGSRQAFFNLFEGLAPGETLSVEVAGIGTGEPNQVLGADVLTRL